MIILIGLLLSAIIVAPELVSGKGGSQAKGHVLVIRSCDGEDVFFLRSNRSRRRHEMLNRQESWINMADKTPQISQTF